MKKEFLEFVNRLMVAAPEVVEKYMTDDIKEYLIMLAAEKAEKEELTEKGKAILRFMQTSEAKMFKARDVAEGLGVASRAISGSFRKLVENGFCEKVGDSPAIYTLTEKGKNYIFEGENLNNEENN